MESQWVHECWLGGIYAFLLLSPCPPLHPPAPSPPFPPPHYFSFSFSLLFATRFPRLLLFPPYSRRATFKLRDFRVERAGSEGGAATCFVPPFSLETSLVLYTRAHTTHTPTRGRCASTFTSFSSGIRVARSAFIAAARFPVLCRPRDRSRGARDNHRAPCRLMTCTILCETDGGEKERE